MGVLDGDTKKNVLSIGRNGLFYAHMKIFKRDFGSLLFAAHERLSQLLKRKPISWKDKVSWQQFYKGLKWLLSIGYETCLLSYENLPIAIPELPRNL